MRRSGEVLLVLLLLLQLGCASQGGGDTIPEEDARTVQLRRAQLSEQGGARYKALAIYQAILADTPDDVAVLQLASELADRIGEAAAAAAWYESLARLQPEVLDWRERLAMNQIQLGRLGAARESLMKIFAVAPTRWMALSGLGLLADIEGNYAEAQIFHLKAIEYGWDQPVAHNNYGYSLLMAQRYAEAEQAFRNGLYLERGNERLGNNLVIALAWQGRYEDAVQEGRKSFKEWIVYNNVGYIAQQRGDYPTAISMFQTALSTSPSFYPKAAENLQGAQRLMDRR